MNVEGKNQVLEALKSGATIDVLLVEKGQNHNLIALARQQNIKIQYVDRAVLDKQSVTKHHQGFIAKTSEFEYCEPQDILDAARLDGGKAFFVLLDGVEDPHNFGSIIRVCECAGVSGIIIPKHRSASVNETVVRVSAGASQHMKIARVTNINQAIEWLKEQNVWVYCADMQGEPAYGTALTGDIALVIGGEGFGVKKLTRELCDKTLSLPLLGKVNSLNASVACGVMVYEAVRQRSAKK